MSRLCAEETGAQQALDASGPARLSSYGVVLMRAVAGLLGIGPLDLPWAEGPRLWRAEDIAAHLPLFKDYAQAGEAGMTSSNLDSGFIQARLILTA
jgi:hypothetical protein